MELTSNPDILRVAKNGAKFFVNGVAMHFAQWSDGKCYLLNKHPDNGNYRIYVRYPENHINYNVALMGNVEELIALLKSGEFEIS